MISRIVVAAAGIAALALSAPPSARAQIIGTVTPPTAADCARATDALRSGSLVATDSQDMAVTYIHSCGTDGMNALATAMRRRRTSTLSTSTYGVFEPATADTALMNAAFDLALDGSAAPSIRALAERLLLSYMGNYDPASYRYFADLAEGESCAAIGVNKPYPTSNLPANIADLVRARVAPLEHDAAQPLIVRSAANCIMNTWRVAQQLPLQPVMTFTTVPVTLEYACGSRFRVKNAAPWLLTVQYRVGSDSTTKQLLASGAKAGEAFGTTILDTLAPGAAVQLIFDGNVVGTASATGITCY
jgi:hypothetical protein